MDRDDVLKVRPCEGVVWRIIDNEVVILSPQDVSIHALTGCGDRVWELIQNQATIADIIETICAEYEVEPATATKDITEFIRKLTDMKLVEMVPAYEEVTH